ncbi:MAG: sulfotransferase family protein [Acidobacteriota bacterium]
MTDPIRRFLRQRKYGDEIIIVSGLPRSGTSMMMKMLEAAGLPIMTDHQRAADDDNPEGYFEEERVKDLGKQTDKSWLRQARGKVLKVISHLLEELPDDNFYRVILMRRDLDEVLASQQKMLEHRGKENPIADKKAKDHYLRHLVQVRFMVRAKPNFELLEADYRRALKEPAAFAAEIGGFLGRRLDTAAMAAIVDQQLYRNRKHQLH